MSIYWLAPEMITASQRKTFEAEVATLEQSREMFEKLK